MLKCSKKVIILKNIKIIRKNKDNIYRDLNNFKYEEPSNLFLILLQLNNPL